MRLINLSVCLGWIVFSAGCGSSSSASASVDSDAAARTDRSLAVDQQSMPVSTVEDVLNTGTAPYVQSFKAFLHPLTGHPTIKLSELLRGKIQKTSAHLIFQNAAVLPSSSSGVPATFDWRSQPTASNCNISSVFNQGQCGSCWANSSAYMMGNAYCIQKSMNPGILSAQYLIDSAIGYSNSSEGITAPAGNGCAGGNPVVALHISKTNGIPLNSCRSSMFNSSAAGAVACIGGDTCARCSCAGGQAVNFGDPGSPATTTLVAEVNGVTGKVPLLGLPVVFGYASQSNLALTVQTLTGSNTIINVPNISSGTLPLLPGPYTGLLGITTNNPMENSFNSFTNSYSCYPASNDASSCTFSTTCDNGTPISGNTTVKVSKVTQIDNLTLRAISKLQNPTTASATLPVDTTDPSYVSAIGQIKNMVQTYGPVTVGFNVPISFMLYSSGVYSYTGWIPYANDSAPRNPVFCTAANASTVCAIGTSSGPNLQQLYGELKQIAGTTLATNCVSNFNGPGLWLPVTGFNTGICAIQDAFEGGHAVSIVGWGTDSTTNQNYWIMANNWGSGWAENGFFKMAMNGMTGAQIIWYDFIAAAGF